LPQRGDENVEKLINALESFTTKVLIVDEKEVNWFPRHLSELDLIANRTLDAGADLESDHPGFNDEVYRARRTELAKVAQNYIWNQPIPNIEYTDVEKKTWQAVWERMDDLLDKVSLPLYTTDHHTTSHIYFLPQFCFSPTVPPQIHTNAARL